MPSRGTSRDEDEPPEWAGNPLAADQPTNRRRDYQTRRLGLGPEGDGSAAVTAPGCGAGKAPKGAKQR